MINRIKEYIEFKGISIHKFEQSVGMSNGAFANALKKGKTIYAASIANIVETYKDLSPEWLLTGRGNMIKSEENESMHPTHEDNDQIPFYAIDFLGGFAEMFNAQDTEPDGYLSSSLIRDAECWCKLTGHSMEPTIDDGDMIALKAENNWASSMKKGNIYAIITSNGLRTVKRLGSAKDENMMKLEPDNEDYKPLEIEKSSITHVFKVLGNLHRFE